MLFYADGTVVGQRPIIEGEEQPPLPPIEQQNSYESEEEYEEETRGRGIGGFFTSLFRQRRPSAVAEGSEGSGSPEPEDHGAEHMHIVEDGVVADPTMEEEPVDIGVAVSTDGAEVLSTAPRKISSVAPDEMVPSTAAGATGAMSPRRMSDESYGGSTVISPLDEKHVQNSSDYFPSKKRPSWIRKSSSLAPRLAAVDETAEDASQSCADLPYVADLEKEPMPEPISEYRLQRFNTRTVLLKLDVAILPLLTLMYLFIILDRLALPMARAHGMGASIELSERQWDWITCVTYFTLTVFAIPSNLVLTKLPASFWLPCVALVAGITTAMTQFAHGFWALVAARLCTGIAEAGFYPGATYYLTLWYAPEELQFRQAILFSAAAVAGGVQGLLGYGIAKMDNVAGLPGWRWIFILLGCATFAAGLLALLVNSFATFLTTSERAFVEERLKVWEHINDLTEPQDEERVPVWQSFFTSFTNWHVYIAVVVLWAILCPLNSLTPITPTILVRWGHPSTALSTQLLTLSIHLPGAILAIAIGLLSDLTRQHHHRFPFTPLSLLLILGGTLLLLLSSLLPSLHPHPAVPYAAALATATGAYTALPGVVTWLASTLSPRPPRAFGLAIAIGTANLAGAAPPWLFRPAYSPHYILGYAVELGIAGLGLCVVAAVALVALGRRKVQKAVARAAERRVWELERETEVEVLRRLRGSAGSGGSGMGSLTGTGSWATAGTGGSEGVRVREVEGGWVVERY